jgi:Ca2+-dependent lipid-binding protein
MDEKPKAPAEPLPDYKEGNQRTGKFKIRVRRGLNFPEAKASDQYYVSVSIMWAEDGQGKPHVKDKKISKSKTVVGIQPEWNEDFTIETPDPEWCLMTIKLKKSSKLGLKKSTVGSVVDYASALRVNRVNRLQLFKKSCDPVGDAYLELEIKYLPEVIPRSEPKGTPAKVPPSNNKKNDNQPRQVPKDPHALPPNLEKSQLPLNRAMDEKPKAPAESLPDCKEGNQTPKDLKIRVQRGVNLPEAKDSDQYYVSMQVQEGSDTIRQQDKKVGKSKTIRGSQPEWNKDFTIKTTNPEECQMTIKVKKSAKLGLKESTVGFVKLDVSSLNDGLNKLQLYDKSNNPVGKACLEVEITSSAKV